SFLKLFNYSVLIIRIGFGGLITVLSHMYLKNTNNRNIKQKLTTLVISNLAILTPSFKYL
ncbi:hypothetical protein ACQKHV_08530, partial [Staphylococcus hominis]|uniref:hypothetical protein n=1 Tax=Staphylococcus hominis TaxID=1290 RepID=UPI003CFC117E